MNYKHKANMALVISLIFFCSCVVLRFFYREVFIFKLMLFVSEASLVGGIADWFAITALFTKPLGFPYHTEIIPRNRKTIINSTANLVETDLLSKETLKKQVDKLSVVDQIIKYVDDDKAIKAKYIDKLTKMIINYIQEKDLKEVTVYVENVIKGEGKNIKLSDKLKEFTLNKFVYENRVIWAQKFLNEISGEDGDRKLRVFSQKIFSSNEEGLGFSLKGILKKLNISFADDLAVKLKEQLEKILTGFMRKDDIFAQICVDKILDTMEGVENSPASIEEWKLNLLEEADLKPTIEAQLPLLMKEEAIRDIVEKLWDYFKENTIIKNAIDNGAREIICNLLEKNHKIIGSIASDTLNSFTDEKLNQFVEEKAGEDLQWIRINGSVLGGCIGLVLFLFLNLIMDPYVVPVFQEMFH